MQAGLGQGQLPMDGVVKDVGLLFGFEVPGQMMPANVARAPVQRERREMRHHVVDAQPEGWGWEGGKGKENFEKVIVLLSHPSLVPFPFPPHPSRPW